MLPNHILAKILELCDNSTHDEALCVSSQFLEAVRDARRQKIKSVASQPARITDELLPTRSELCLDFCLQPHFKNILETMKPLGLNRDGPLYKHYKEQIKFDTAFNEALARGRPFGGKAMGHCIRHSSGETLGHFGGWENDQPEGFGKMLDNDNPSRLITYFGLNYEGEYVKGKRDGYGFMLSQSNFWFEEFFKDNHAHGRGILAKIGTGMPDRYDRRKIKEYKTYKTEGVFNKGVWEEKTNFKSGLTDIMKIESFAQPQKIFKEVTLNRKLGFIHRHSNNPERFDLLDVTSSPAWWH